MIDDPPGSAPLVPENPQPHGTQFVPGDRIRIAAGKLTGLTGKVVSHRDRQNFVLTIDGWADGVYVIVSSQSLERL